jgi:hypothetical protein
MYLEESKKILKKYPQITSEFKGCSEEEINNLELIINKRIPEAFEGIPKMVWQKWRTNS